LYSAKLIVLRCASSIATKQVRYVLKCLANVATVKDEVLGMLTENSRGLHRRVRSLWRRIPFLFSGRQAFGYQQTSGVICWPRTKPARGRKRTST